MNRVSTDAIRSALREAGLLVDVRDPLPPTVAGVTDDSRQVEAGGMFVAVRGTLRDGHDFLPSVADRAGAVVVEDVARTELPALIVSDSRRAASIVAAAAEGHPARRLRLVAVTGTNGKTTTVGMLRHVLDEPDAHSASIGTLGVLVGSEGAPIAGGSGLTTPGPVELQRVLRLLADAGVKTVAMEVSSHSLEQHRVDGVSFDAAVFTNLTRDHLDYHGTMEAYAGAKARLLDHLAPGGAAVLNADDPAWDALPVIGRRRVRFSLVRDDADVRARGVRYTSSGSEWTLAAGADRARVRLPLIGDFNVANALGAAAAAWAVGRVPQLIARRLSSLPQVPGRLEVLHTRPTVLRDYSHTPDSLERALAAVRPFTDRRLIVVFGCGGDRDPGKRPIMGGIAERLADLAIVTSDNPRTEDPERIIDDIERGMTASNHERITDRRAAIARALHLAAVSDVILLAGKGHETYQIRGTTYHPFDEREIVRELAGDNSDAPVSA